ncbi:hypothetical protein RJ640_017504 [Escallonia rubra]|uniref:Uncharacterized protein n=1 Tax=Escallonia rubra TaxID=112253 RepID=A0AA88RL09_9ASTE|nr:hypothetical protein RJ640_017504 [Escallonia rubra]
MVMHVFHFDFVSQMCPDTVYCLKWTPNGRRLITGSQSGEFTLWSGQHFNFEMLLQAHDQAIRSMVNANLAHVWGHQDISTKYWQNNMNNVKANKSAHKESVRDLRTDLKFCSCSDDTAVKVWDFARCQEERSLSVVLVVCSHGHKNTVLCVKWNQNGNWVLTASKDQIIKLYDIRAMKELESFRGHRKDVTGKSLGAAATPRGSNDHTTKFWCRNRPGDPARDKIVGGYNQGYGEQNPALAGRMPGNFPGLEAPPTPGPFATGFTRNDGTIPGVGVAMPLSISSLDSSVLGEQKPPISTSAPLGAPPLPPGPHPSLFVANQQHAYQQNAQQGQQHHQSHQQQMTSLPLPPPNLSQLQHPSHLPQLQTSQFPRPPPQLQQINRPLSIPSSMQGSLPMPSMPMHGPMGMQGTMNQMVPPMPQGHFMGMNPMHSGLVTPGGPQAGGIPNGLQNMQGPSNASGSQMYQPGNSFSRPQSGQMPPMPGLNPYQSGNPNATGMGSTPSNFNVPPPLPPAHGISEEPSYSSNMAPRNDFQPSLHSQS